ncbi:TetR/AcrR family transcriptional regulator [Rhizobium sp. G187]|uniref:TetR/AcrR family transcriptional regulator n=1 Tax=Rhizobium sp. G187 TaxID=3451352 RepID=UPI003EE7BEC6
MDETGRMNGEGRRQPLRRGPGRPRQNQDDEIRTRLVGIAFSFFVAHGYEATSVAAIAAAGQVSKRTVYQLFPGKIDLFAASVAHHRSLMFDVTPPDQDTAAEEQLARLFCIDIDPQTAAIREAFLARAVEAMRLEPALVPIIEAEGVEASRRALTDWLAEGSRIGLLSIDDPLETAHILMEIVFGAMALKTGQGTEWPGGADRAAFLRRCFRLLVTGIGAR